MMFAAIQGWLGFGRAEVKREWFRLRLHGTEQWMAMSVQVTERGPAIPGHYEYQGPFKTKAEAEGDGFAKGE